MSRGINGEVSTAGPSTPSDSSRRGDSHASQVHPATPIGDPEGVAQTIAQSERWVPVHLVIVVGLILMLGGLVAISRSIQGGVGGALAQLGSVAAVAGVTVGVILVIVDGVTAKHLADAGRRHPPIKRLPHYGWS
jgi:hypothetical protein